MTSHLLDRRTGWSPSLHRLIDGAQLVLRKLHQIQFDAPWDSRRSSR